MRWPHVVIVVRGSSAFLFLYVAFVDNLSLRDVVNTLFSSDTSVHPPRVFLVALLMMGMTVSSGLPWSARLLRTLPISKAKLTALFALPIVSLCAALRSVERPRMR